MVEGHVHDVRIPNPKRRRTLTPCEHFFSEYVRKKEIEYVEKEKVNLMFISKT